MSERPSDEPGAAPSDETGPLEAVFADVVAAVTRQAAVTSRDHARFERALRESGEQLSAKVEEEVFRLGQSVRGVEEAVQELRGALFRRLLADLAAAHAELDRLRTTRRHAEDPESLENWAEGVLIVADRLERALERWGVARVPAEGEAYRVEWHQAVERRAHGGAPEGRVLKEVEPGYYFPESGQVLVRARVILSAGESPVVAERTGKEG